MDEKAFLLGWLICGFASEKYFSMTKSQTVLAFSGVAGKKLLFELSSNFVVENGGSGSVAIWVQMKSILITEVQIRVCLDGGRRQRPTGFRKVSAALELSCLESCPLQTHSQHNLGPLM